VLQVSADLWVETLGHFRNCGQGKAECVAYLVGRIEEEHPVKTVHPQHASSARFYELDEGWLNDFWIGLARDHERVLIQVHTHAGLAFHSPTDDAWPIVHTAGFLSLVLPGFALDDACLRDAFLAELQPDGTWRQVPVASRISVGG
jgi:proteasome lid subunit RPN8/RPN11